MIFILAIGITTGIWLRGWLASRPTVSTTEAARIQQEVVVGANKRVEQWSVTILLISSGIHRS
jgi:hypothetical protein